MGECVGDVWGRSENRREKHVVQVVVAERRAWFPRDFLVQSERKNMKET